jgi:hypothetical protein
MVADFNRKIRARPSPEPPSDGELLRVDRTIEVP